MNGLKSSRWIVAAALLAAVGCSKSGGDGAPQEEYTFRPVIINRCYLAMLENPGAARALLVGGAAVKCRGIFENAGVAAFTEPGGAGKFDLIVVACDAVTPEELKEFSAMLAEKGVIAWFIDARNLTAGEFYDRLLRFDLPQVHFWMAGENQWLATGSREFRRLKLDDMAELFSREEAFEQIGEMRCGTLPGLFAAYAGTIEEVMPAFINRKRPDRVRPEHFLTKEIPRLDWISTEGTDADIAKMMTDEIRSMQIVRRLVVEGAMDAAAAKDRKGEEKATEKWHRAALRNPDDLFLLERIERLERNAKGFLALGKVLQAMKCYETMVLINPRDASAVHNFGVCLKKIGRLDIAKKVLARAEKLSESGESR
ncbi:MAG: hypothetical protein J6T01_05660 [Kiritimatiellae bacterium]|nr:hypothetical protein [Kiritimatiellia bacterium]